jgi:hypothetical protein
MEDRPASCGITARLRPTPIAVTGAIGALLVAFGGALQGQDVRLKPQGARPLHVEGRDIGREKGSGAFCAKHPLRGLQAKGS